MQEQAVRITVGIEMAINLIINFVLNALCAWLIARNAGGAAVGFWSVAIDTYITCHCVCILVTLFSAASAGRYLKKGIFVVKESPGSLLSDFPRRPWLLGLLLAELVFLPLTAVFGGGFALLHISYLGVWPYAVFKGVWGGILGAAVCCTVLHRYRLGGRQVRS